MRLKSIIVDDEKNGRENLSGLLRQYCQHVELVGEADSVKSATLLIKKNNPDLIFLDIEMPEADGFKLLESFKDLSFEVIFVTAYDNYAIKAIKFSAADYILKPINSYELQQAVNKVYERIRSRQENKRIKQLYQNIRYPAEAKIGLPHTDKVVYVDAKSIVRLQGESNYTHVFFDKRKPLLIAKTLVEFEELLEKYSFIRTHKSHLVNLLHVSTLVRTDGGYLEMSNGDQVSISRRRKEEVIKQLKMG